MRWKRQFQLKLTELDRKAQLYIEKFDYTQSRYPLSGVLNTQDIRQKERTGKGVLNLFMKINYSFLEQINKITTLSIIFKTNRLAIPVFFPMLNDQNNRTFSVKAILSLKKM